MNKRSNTYDVIVVGSGASGGWVAKILCEKGAHVLMLEAGPPRVRSLRRIAVWRSTTMGGDVVRELESENPQSICREGLAALKQRGFEALDSTAQLTHLVNLETANDPFIAWVKRRVLDGFYTSRQGLGTRL